MLATSTPAASAATASTTFVASALMAVATASGPRMSASATSAQAGARVIAAVSRFCTSIRRTVETGLCECHSFSASRTSHHSTIGAS